ncbi:glycosyltransferase involved in cell wall biosynthesis [Streptomyces phaeoluteigriseus]
MHVLVVHNRYASAQPSGENKVVDQEVALLREAGHRVEVFERRSDDIAAMSLLAKVAVPLRVPWNPAVRAELAARLRTERPDVVHVHNVFPLLSPAVLAACADAGVPAVATLHNYTQICPPGTLQRGGRPCTECVGSTPLPAVRRTAATGARGWRRCRSRSACRSTGGGGGPAWSGSSASPRRSARSWCGPACRPNGWR